MPTTRAELKSYCLRRLGDPVITINVADAQLEDRIDDALEYFKEYHSDGIEKAYKVITVQQTDIDNQELALNDADIYSVSKVLSMTSDGTSVLDRGFSLEYQFVLSELSSFKGLDTVSFYLMNEKLGNIQRLFAAGKMIQYNRYRNALKLFIDWSTLIPNESTIVIECDKFIDEATVAAVWNDRWIKRYTTALFKKQWGENLKKLNNVQLPGGVTIPGQQIYDEAVDEINKIEEEMIDWYSDPVDFFVG